MFPAYKSILVKNALLYEEAHPLCGKCVHVFVENGMIAHLELSLSKLPLFADCVVEGEEVGISPRLARFARRFL